jgi:hypothetical protein
VDSGAGAIAAATDRKSTMSAARVRGQKPDASAVPRWVAGVDVVARGGMRQPMRRK